MVGRQFNSFEELEPLALVGCIGVSRRKCLEGQRRGRQLLDSKYLWCRKGLHIS